MLREEIEIERGELEDGPGPDLALDRHQDQERRVRVHHSVEMKEIITLLGGGKNGQMMVGGVPEETTGTGGMIQRNRMKTQEVKKMISLQILMIPVPQISREMTVPAG